MQYFAGIELIDDETSDSIIEIAIKNFPICIILKIIIKIIIYHMNHMIMIWTSIIEVYLELYSSNSNFVKWLVI